MVRRNGAGILCQADWGERGLRRELDQYITVVITDCSLEWQPVAVVCLVIGIYCHFGETFDELSEFINRQPYPPQFSSFIRQDARSCVDWFEHGQQGTQQVTSLTEELYRGS